ncbi:MAG: reverse transcriptase/maturase family protein [Fimbriimonadaceae bacterium]|nr:reverse transcriptase/maturase family protein [Fimbriimonadaceae bacterium]
MMDEVFGVERLCKAFDEVIAGMRCPPTLGVRQREQMRMRVRRLKKDKLRIIAGIVEDYSKFGTVHFSSFTTRVPKRVRGARERLISVFPVRQRVVQRSMLETLWPFVEPIVVPSVCHCTFRRGGLHPRRGIAEAVSVVSTARDRRPYFFKTDIEAFFDSVDRKKLNAIVRSLIPDERFCGLVRAVVEAERRIDHQWIKEGDLADNCGVPQGCTLSPLLACTYLSSFDSNVRSRNINMIRYVDDILVICDSFQDASSVKAIIQETLSNEYSLNLSEQKTSIIAPDEVIEFLGHSVDPDGVVRPTKERLNTIRAWVFAIVDELPGRSDAGVISDLSSYLLGFFISMRHCDFTQDDFMNFGALIGDALQNRGLDRNRLSKGLRLFSNKWPPGFLRGLP